VVKKGYSYTSTPPMGRMGCTEPRCLYKGALYLPLMTCWSAKRSCRLLHLDITALQFLDPPFQRLHVRTGHNII